MVPDSLSGDQLDACDQSFDIADKNCPDEHIVAVQLFADIDFTDEAAVAARVTEYEEIAADVAAGSG